MNSENYLRGDTVRGQYFDTDFTGTVIEVVQGYAGGQRVFVALDAPVMVYGTPRDTVCCTRATGWIELEKKTQKPASVQLTVPIRCV